MLNRITFMGRVTRNPELKSTNSGLKVTTFTVACDRDYSSGEKQTDFIDCTAWRAKAEFICRNFSKGMPILVEGRLQSRKWTDRDGNKRVSWEVQVEEVYFCGGERKGAAPDQNKAFEDLPDDGELPWKDDDDDLPL